MHFLTILPGCGKFVRHLLGPPHFLIEDNTMARTKELIEALLQVVADDLQSKSSVIDLFVEKVVLTGGWEPWLQVQFAARICYQMKYTTLSREQAYPANAKGPAGLKYDLCFTGISGGADIYAELKTQRTGAYAATLNDLGADVQKIKGFDVTWRNGNVLFAAALLKASAADSKTMNELRQSDMSHYWFYLYDGKGWTKLDSNSTIPDVAGKFVMVAWGNS
jgi:hypothetical protein